MKLQLFVIYCILQSIHATDDRDILENTVLYIAGGREAPDRLAPYQCSIQDVIQHFCGCAVINSNFVLTASHCLILATPQQIKIMVGSNDFKTGTFYEAERLITHEHFNKPTRLANDIGLVKVKGPIQFNENVQPVVLQETAVPDGSEVMLTGWGRLYADGYVTRKMQYIMLNIIGMDKCNSSSVSEKITDNLQDGNICTNGAVGFGACKGDSGGSLTYNTKLVGIVSFGIPCGEGQPDVYANVSYYSGWIKEHISISPTTITTSPWL
ncbi:chymotrypsin-2-like [Bradysia coprophila]|uniref:chymotrypsin-2-like n=1 Tax=Bradysia coprophila TaxID=38358 RepID=UPI00187D8F41|nr:chymotrypsin-2-like [Bradysia coprophila]XP_037047342.1 chymotrypsin-2-like [Bradysia coprophila]